MLILAICHDKIQMNARHTREVAQGPQPKVRAARELLHMSPSILNSTYNKNRIRSATRRANTITRVAASFAKDPLKHILDGSDDDLPDFTPVRAQALRAIRKREKGLIKPSPLPDLVD